MSTFDVKLGCYSYIHAQNILILTIAVCELTPRVCTSVLSVYIVAQQTHTHIIFFTSSILVQHYSSWYSILVQHYSSWYSILVQHYSSWYSILVQHYSSWYSILVQHYSSWYSILVQHYSSWYSTYAGHGSTSD